MDHFKELEELVRSTCLECNDIADFSSSLKDLKAEADNVLQVIENHLEDQKASLSDMKSKIEEKKEVFGTLEKQHEVVKKDLNKLKEEESRKQKQMSSIDREIAAVGFQIKRKEAKMSGNAKEKEIFSRKVMEAKAFEALTGIVFDVTAPEGTVEGYITNKEKDNYVSVFTYTMNKMTEAEIQECLWEEVEKSTATSWSPETLEGKKERSEE